jgi:(p)ppGpp synthase/HD superfamily hydrolase
MDNKEMQSLTGLILAPWIQKASALVGVKRKVGGNQFRHCMASMTILIDYHFINGPMLKASIIHDLLEDFKSVDQEEIRRLDSEGEKVLSLVRELTRDPQKETKEEYFERLIHNSSSEAKIVKLADRISNLTDLHLYVFEEDKTEYYLDQTEKYILPMISALQDSVIANEEKMMVREMAKEIRDLVFIRRTYLEEFRSHESLRLKLLKRLGITRGKVPEE